MTIIIHHNTSIHKPISSHLTLILALHSVGFQVPPLSTQPLKSLDISFSTSCILGTLVSTYKGPTEKAKIKHIRSHLRDHFQNFVTMILSSSLIAINIPYPPSSNKK